jgi:hypothetical protein
MVMRYEDPPPSFYSLEFRCIGVSQALHRGFGWCILVPFVIERGETRGSYALSCANSAEPRHRAVPLPIWVVSIFCSFTNWLSFCL